MLIYAHTQTCSEVETQKSTHYVLRALKTQMNDDDDDDFFYFSIILTELYHI